MKSSHLTLIASTFTISLACKPINRKKNIATSKDTDAVLPDVPNLDQLLRFAAEEIQTGKFSLPIHHPEVQLTDFSTLVSGMQMASQGANSYESSGMALSDQNTNSDFEKGIDSITLAPNVTSVKDQGKEGACSAFALIAAMETKFMLQGGPKIDLSSAQMWSLYKTPNAQLQYDAALKNIIWPEKFWTWDSGPKPIPPNTFGVQLKQFHQLTNLDDIHKNLKAGNPIVFAAKMNTALNDPGEDGFIEINSKSNEELRFLSYGHMFLIVGSMRFGKPVNGYSGVWLFKNSWGTNWGKDGYGVMPYEYCKLQADACVAIAIQSVEKKVIPPSNGRSYKVGLGLVPGQKGQEFDCRGLSIAEITTGGLGSLAGIKKGDCLISVAQFTIQNLQDYDDAIQNLSVGNAKSAEFGIYRGPGQPAESKTVIFGN